VYDEQKASSTYLPGSQHFLSEADMSDLTISLPEDELAKLREKAATYGVSAEELVRAGIDHLLESPEEEFQRAADYVLKKNEELYRRLA
jgi:antitoxin FitA